MSHPTKYVCPHPLRFCLKPSLSTWPLAPPAPTTVPKKLRDMPDVTSISINTIRTLCMDAVQQANSGHPGTPMAMAPVVYALWQDYLRFDPADPIWPNRDRFILSAGHASTLILLKNHSEKMLSN